MAILNPCPLPDEREAELAQGPRRRPRARGSASASTWPGCRTARRESPCCGRGGWSADALRAAGHEPLEVYPFATLRLLGLPWRDKKSRAGRRRIHRALKPLVPGLNHPRATEHQLDAVICSLTALLWRCG